MSEPAEGERLWHLYVLDMLACARKVMAYTTGFDQSALVADAMRYDATLRNLELIGEAATRISAAIRAAHPEIPWRQLVATRNRLIHGYLGIDDDIIWSIIRDDVPSLIEALDHIRPPEP